MSQLLLRLRTELDTCSDHVQRAELGARIACYLARIGRFDEARHAVTELRKEFGDGRSGRATVWIMLAEGLTHLFGDLSPQALDRVTRAQVIALAMRHKPAIAYASAWKAHIEFEISAFDAMLKSIRVAFDAAASTDEDALTRLSIVLSNSFMICGAQEVAQKWFVRGHEQAVRNGDQASIEALLYNRTAFRLAYIRAQICLGESYVDDFALVRKEVNSSKNLQALTGTVSLTSHTQLWSARLSLAEGQYDAAARELNLLKGAGPFADYNFSDQMIALEVIYCMAKSGNVEEAASAYNQVHLDCFDRLDIDEQLSIAWMRFELAQLDSRFGSLDECRTGLEEMRAIFLQARKELFVRLGDWVDI